MDYQRSRCAVAGVQAIGQRDRGEAVVVGPADEAPHLQEIRSR